MEQSNNTIKAAHQGAVILVCWFSLGTVMLTIRIPDPECNSKGLPHSSPGDTAWMLLSPCCCMSLPSHTPWRCPGLSGQRCCLPLILHTAGAQAPFVLRVVFLVYVESKLLQEEISAGESPPFVNTELLAASQTAACLLLCSVML